MPARVGDSSPEPYPEEAGDSDSWGFSTGRRSSQQMLTTAPAEQHLRCMGVSALVLSTAKCCLLALKEKAKKKKSNLSLPVEL